MLVVGISTSMILLYWDATRVPITVKFAQLVINASNVNLDMQRILIMQIK